MDRAQKRLWQGQQQEAVAENAFDFEMMAAMPAELVVKYLGTACGPIQLAAIETIRRIPELELVRAGGIHRLVSLLGCSNQDVQEAAAVALSQLVATHRDNMTLVAELGGAAAVQMATSGHHYQPDATLARQGRVEAVFGEEGAEELWGLTLHTDFTRTGEIATIIVEGPTPETAAAGWGLVAGMALVSVVFEPDSGQHGSSAAAVTHAAEVLL
eukprot:SAG31_NODE_13366_length_874_cov_1.331613_2_plen_213_part_01